MGHYTGVALVESRPVKELQENSTENEREKQLLWG